VLAVPVLGFDGAVISIPTLAAVNGGGAAPGIGFAIPASDAVTVGRQLTSSVGANPGSALNRCHR
jgi:putative serine protease PepD